MKHRGMAIVGALLATAVSLTACSQVGTTGVAPTTAPPTLSPTNALTAALGKLKAQGYDITATLGGGAVTGHGSVDPAHSSATTDESGVVNGDSIRIAVIQIGTSLWVKYDFGAQNPQMGLDPSKWMLVDQSKLTGTTSKQFDLSGPDALDVSGLLTSVSAVTATDATHLTGTIDLTAATGLSKPDPSDLDKAGAAAKTTPFTATLDGQGRLADLKINADASNKDLSVEFVYSNYGSPTAITPPAAADTIPASAVAYQILNG